jgi:hypothetical protein
MSSEIVYSETPVKEIWSRLGYFENEHNAKEFLSEKNKSLSQELTQEQLTDISQRLSFSMQSAKEYYQSATFVTLLTKPLLIFYGMVALSKVLFIATYMKKSPSRGHGLESPKDDFGAGFCNISTTVEKDGTFPQFHCCYDKRTLCGMEFTLNELLSVVPEVKVEYETVFRKKSNSIEMQKSEYYYNVVDDDGLEKYDNFYKRLSKLGIGLGFVSEDSQVSGKTFPLHDFPDNLAKIRSLSGKEFLQFSLTKHDSELNLPEMSAHYLIMYLLGMASRYYPKEWGEITEGKASGDIYVIKKFLEVTERKFPNLILNSLRNREFVFVSPQLDEEQELSYNQLDRISRYVEEQLNEKMRRSSLTS